MLVVAERETWLVCGFAGGREWSLGGVVVAWVFMVVLDISARQG